MADLTSGVGALFLGIGLGGLLANHLGALSNPILFLGLVMHVWGMYRKNKLEVDRGLETTFWEKTLYWTCWILLALLVAIFIFKAVSGI